MTDRIASSQPPTGAQECSHGWSDAALSIAEPVDTTSPNNPSKPPKGATGRAATPQIALADLMRTAHAALLCFVIALLCSAVRADQATTNQNAALVYRTLFSLRGEPAVEQLDALESVYRGGSKSDVETGRAVVAVHRALIDGLLEASTIEKCDWETPTDPGPMTLLPQLGAMREAGMLLRAEARIRFDAGDPAGATTALVALCRIARHARGTDTFLICGLVEAAMLGLAVEEINRALDRGLLDKTDKASLRQAIERFDPKDPHGLRGSIAADRDSVVDWFRQSYQSGQPLTPGMQEFAYIHRSEEYGLANAKQLQGIIERGDPIEPQLILLKGFYDAALAAWDGPNPRSAFADLIEKTNAGKYGPIASLLCPPFLSKTRETHDKSIANLALLRKRLAH